MASASNSLWSTLWLSVLRPALIGGLFVLGLGVACSDQSKLNSAQLSVSSNNPTPDAMGPCPDGLRRECGVTLGRQGDVVNCAKGAQLCSAGKWGTCEETSKFDVSATASGSPLKTLSLSMPAPCVNNPCDPACRFFDEMPMVPYQPAPDPTQLWKTGSLLDYPTTTLVRVEPCSTVSDCQAGLECDQVLDSCVRHVAGQTDISCATADLIVAPTCSDAGVDIVPVCNRGSVAAPTGVKLAMFAPGQIRTLNPMTATATCLTTAIVPPGKCIDVTGCGTLANGAEIMVNPQDGTEKPECELDNNWSVFQAGVCNQSICQAGKATGDRNECEIPLRGVSNVGAVLYGRWPLNEGAGTTAVDVSGLTNNLTVSAGATWPAGRLGGALLISPTGPKIASASVNLGDTTELSVAFWMKNNGANDYAGGLVSHLNTATLKGWQVQRTAAGRLQVELAAAGSTITYNATLAPNDNNWHHVAFTWNGTTGALRIYVDGLQTEAATHNAVTTLGTGDRPMSFGKTPGGAVLNGAIDDVSIYRGVLEAAQVYQMSLSNGASTGTPPYSRVKFTPRQAGAIVTPSCPAGWTAWSNRCYKNFGGAATTLTAKESACVAQGGHLLSLNRLEEKAFVLATWPTVEGVVLGLSDQVAEGTWLWSDGSCNQWTDWHAGADAQPDGLPVPVPMGGSGTEQDCTYINPSYGTTWRDIECYDANDDWSRVCEKGLTNPQGSCAVGQVAGKTGTCYESVTAAPLSYAQAASACAAKGIGWGLADVSSISENDFVASVVNCAQPWVGSVSGANFLAGEPTGTAGANCLRLNNLGKWLDDTCSTARPYLCEGPPLAPPVANGAPQDLTLVANLPACNANNQYYLDDPLNPTLAILCPSMCSRLTDTPSDLVYEFGCRPPLGTNVVTQTYESDCPAGTQAQWAFLVHHTTTPGDSDIQFEVRTAASVAALASAAFLTAGVAKLSPMDTQNCWYTDSCRVDLFELLKTPANRFQTLEIRATLTPNSSYIAPQLQDWEVTFSCQASQ